jgi:hypothetical protein
MADVERIRLWIPAPADLLTLNTARGRIHWRQWAALTKAWRDQAKLEAEASGVEFKLEAGARVHIEGLPVQGGGGPLADPGGHMPTLKACVDGLRDAGWIPDDSGRFVAAVTMFPPIRATSHKDAAWGTVHAREAGMAVDLTTIPADVPQLF